MNKAADKPREIFPDILRIFAALLVILLHAQTDYIGSAANFGRPLWWAVLYSGELTRIGVPIFFMLSGYLLLSGKGCENIGAFYKKRFSKLLLPFLWASCIYYLFYRLASGSPIFDKAFIDQLLNTGTAYHLWYLYSLAMLYLFLPFMKMVISHAEKSGRTWILALFLVLLTWQTTLKPTLNMAFSGKLYFYFAPDGMVGYFGYAMLGYILGKVKMPKAVYAVIIGAGLVSFAVFPQLLGHSIIESGDWFWTGGYTINHYIEAAGAFILAKSVFTGDFAASHPKFTKCTSYLSSLTFHVYLIHVLILEFTEVFLGFLTDMMTPSMGIIFTASVVAAVSFALSALWHEIMKTSGTSVSNIR